MEKLTVERIIKKSNGAMLLGLVIIVGLTIFLDNKAYAIITTLVLIFCRLQTMYTSLLLLSDWLDRFKPDLRREYDVY